MNITKSILTGAIVLSALSLAQADTYVRITGSTAYRGQTNTAITHIFDAGFTYGYVGTTFSKAGQAIFKGTIGGNAVIVKTFFTGSVGGIQTVAKNIPQTGWLVDTTPTSPGGTPSAPSTYDAAVTADVTMSDTFQSSTVFGSPGLTDTIVGVVPFRFVASASAPANLNMTPQLAQALWGNGSAPLALFTGNNADEGTTVYATGRDPDSGTRLTAFAETGIGVNSQVHQNKPVVSGGVITSLAEYPQQTVNTIVVVAGNGGESSGGTVAGYMGATGSILMTYLGTSDAATAIGNGAKEMSYNGTFLGADPSNGVGSSQLQEGKYTFWGYEHLMYRSTAAGELKVVADKLANQLATADAQVVTGNMNVSRPGDGGLVTAIYY